MLGRAGRNLSQPSVTIQAWGNPSNAASVSRLFQWPLQLSKQRTRNPAKLLQGLLQCGMARVVHETEEQGEAPNHAEWEEKAKDCPEQGFGRSTEVGPCADYGGRFPIEAMDFDHLEDKQALISKLVYTAGTGRLVEEIAKCEVVCSNCHRVRTSRRLTE